MDCVSIQQGAQKVLLLSQQMLEMAKSAEWALMSRLEQTRYQSLQRLFRHPDIRQNLWMIAETLKEIMRIDKECLSLGEQAKQDMLSTLKGQSQGKRAVQSYRQYS